MPETFLNTTNQELNKMVESLEWYHTIDLGNGIITKGHYDHRPYLHYYRIPEDLSGKTVLDIGAASGFFSFEFEKRGANVTAIDLPEWFDHDFGPTYDPDQSEKSGGVYLHRPFEVAKKALGARVNKKLINIYEISPETVGTFDLVFCSSLLLHLTDPIKAFWNIASVTKEKAIVATVITREESMRPTATMLGFQRGDVWWIPTRTTLELMAVTAGFKGVEWINEFQLNLRGKSTGPYHGVLHAYKTAENCTPQIKNMDEIISQVHNVPDLEREVEHMRTEIEALRQQLQLYEQSRVCRLPRWIHKQIRGIRSSTNCS